MGNTTVSRVEDGFQRGVASAWSDWSLRDSQRKALDVTNHVLRVILQLGRLEEYLPEFDALAQAQLADGGWPNLSGSTESGVRNTCFSARNLIRANRVLRRADFVSAAERAVRLVLRKQDAEGFWPDRVWGVRDATSSGMGLLLYTLKEDFGAATDSLHREAREGLRRAAEYLERTQEPDGSWHDPRAYDAPVGPTAHLLPKLVLAEGRRSLAVERAIAFLRAAQEEDGSWDSGHMDHTCDAARGLLLVQSVAPVADLDPVIDRGVAWLWESTNDEGLWGEHPGEPTSLLMVCDVLDCFSKHEAHLRAQDLRAFWQ